jgi:hypothetical protein
VGLSAILDRDCARRLGRCLAGTKKRPLSAEPRNPTKWVAKTIQARGGRDYPFQMATRQEFLIKRKSHYYEELIPFSKNELHNINTLFARRLSHAVELSHLISSQIDLSHVEFDDPVWAEGFVFPCYVDFKKATFSSFTVSLPSSY